MKALEKVSDALWEESLLVRRAQAGCAESFNAIVSRHYPAVYRLAYRLLNHREEAADATQSTFLRAYRALGEFDVRRALKPWLYRICVNICIDMRRSRGFSQHSLSDVEGVLSAGDESLPQIEREELRRNVRSAIASLPSRYRQVVVLRHYYGLDIGEIAEVVEAPPGTVKSWLFRARAMLRRCLQGVVGGEGLSPSYGTVASAVV